MMNKSKFTNIAKKVLKFKAGIKNHEIMHPAREWFVGLLIGFIIFASSGAWSAYVYLKYKNINDEGEGPAFDLVVYRENQVKDALEYFVKKQELYNEILNLNFRQKETNSVPEDEVDVKSAEGEESLVDETIVSEEGVSEEETVSNLEEEKTEPETPQEPSPEFIPPIQN